MEKRVSKFTSKIMAIICMALFLPIFPTANAATELYWPVPNHTHLSQGFHDGKAIDISDENIAGADVIAAMGGTVTHIFLCTEQHYGSTGDCNGFGTGLVIAGDDGRIYQYAHMQGGSIPSNVYRTARVEGGQKIGKVGTTGNSSGYHLHFGISLEKYWYESGINPQNEKYITHKHSYTSISKTQPTCTQKGIEKLKCSCGDIITKETPAIGHDYTKKVYDPSEKSDGYTIYTCSVCNDSYKGDIVPKLVKNEDGWYYSDKLPTFVNDSEYDVNYKYSYKKKAKTSPGSDWVKGDLAESVYEYVGEPYTTAKQVATSETYVMKDFQYYHYCGPTTGNVANYEFTDEFCHYDAIPKEYSVVVQSTGMDGEYPYFVLGWANDNATVYCKSEVTCDGSYGSHGTRSKAWYRMATYQKREQVNYYYYTKPSVWTDKIDESAQDVTFRFRTKASAEVKYGDANEDTEISLADAVIIMQSICSPSKFGVDGTDEHKITEQGLINADCANVGDGVTNADALAIQKYKLSLITSLPEKK